MRYPPPPLQSARAYGVALSGPMRARLAALVRARGERLVTAATHVSRSALGRALAGLGVRLGTAALIERGLAALEADAARLAAAERPQAQASDDGPADYILDRRGMP